MKYTHHGKHGSLELEGTQAEIWKQLASFEEVFEEPCCGKCKGENLRHVLRKVDKYLYHELRCLDCGAKLAFGMHDDGTQSLFPKRKDKDKNPIGTNGWVKWNAEKNVEE